MVKSEEKVPAGFHTVTPHLNVRDSAKAIEFYKKAFGAQERCIMAPPGGKCMHAEIQIGNSIVMLNDEFPEMDHLGPESRGGSTSHLMLYVDNVDDLFDKAVKAGCTVKLPLQDQFWGDRYGQVVDPFGHIWALSSHVEDLTPEEIMKRSESACKEMAAAPKK